MGSTSKLYISKRFNLDDIVAVMESHLNLKEQKRRKKNIRGEYYTEKFKIDIQSTTVLGMLRLNFIYNNNPRTMTVFDNADLPIKGLYELHLGTGDEATEIFTKIANVLGGLLEEDDCSDKGIQEIQGSLSESNGLPYFIKYALIHNKIENEDDLVGLNETIHKWHDSIKGADRSKMNLFPIE